MPTNEADARRGRADAAKLQRSMDASEADAVSIASVAAKVATTVEPFEIKILARDGNAAAHIVVARGGFAVSMSVAT